MTDSKDTAPERIRVWPDVDDHFNSAREDWAGGIWDDTDDPKGKPYLRADVAQAMVAAAFKEGMLRAAEIAVNLATRESGRDQEAAEIADAIRAEAEWEK